MVKTRCVFLLFGTVLATVLVSHTQEIRPRSALFRETAVTFTAERSQISNAKGSQYWLEGVSADSAVYNRGQLSVQLDVSLLHAANVIPGTDFNKVSYMAGPRYTRALPGSAKLRPDIFAEALFGSAHAYDSTFPGKASLSPWSNAFSMQAGGGFEVPWRRHFKLRVVQAEWVRTQFPNNGTNTQSNFRLSTGIVYRR